MGPPPSALPTSFFSARGPHLFFQLVAPASFFSWWPPFVLLAIGPIRILGYWPLLLLRAGRGQLPIIYRLPCMSKRRRLPGKHQHLPGAVALGAQTQADTRMGRWPWKPEHRRTDIRTDTAINRLCALTQRGPASPYCLHPLPPYTSGYLF